VWITIFVLLGLVLLGAIAGFHSGPHAHVLAAVLGAVAAIWLVVMGANGHTSPLLWTLVGSDIAVSAGLGALGWRGLTSPGRRPSRHTSAALVGVTGAAMTELSPDGVVRVNGESWSAMSLNGSIRAGRAVQVIGAAGLRLEVWGDEEVLTSPSPLGNAHAPRIDGERSADASETRKAGS
jgi:membrane-bound serine protease (ClpP class)